jgi:hypothetical protein
MDLAVLVSKLKQALYALEEVHRVCELLSWEYAPDDKRLFSVLVKLEDALRLLDDALVIAELEYFKQSTSVQERFARGVEKALEG